MLLNWTKYIVISIKKKTIIGYGLPLIDLEKGASLLYVEQEEQKRSHTDNLVK